MRDRHVKVVFLALLPLFTLLAACRGEPTQAPVSSPSKDTRPTLTIALIPEHNVFEQRQRYKPLCDYLGTKLNLSVRVKTLPSYGMICDEFRDGLVDAAFFGSFTYVLAHEQAGVQILARPEYEDSGSAYRGYIFTRRDSGILVPEDGRDRRYAFVHPLTTAGYLFELSHFGVKLGDFPGVIFTEHFFAGSHDATALAVFGGRADWGGGKDRVYKHLEEDQPGFAEEMVVLAESPQVPSNGLAIGPDWPEARRRLLEHVLLSLDQDPQSAKARQALGIRRFLSTSDDDYAPIYAMANDVGIDLTTYGRSLK